MRVLRMPYLSVAFVTAFTLFLGAGQALAHVPYLETEDYTEEDPFEIPRSIRQSLAAYSWLEFEGGFSDDVDVYKFRVKPPWGANVFIESIVPVCPGYEDFLPWFAVVGEGFPAPVGYDLPFDLPPGHGVIVVENQTPGEPREQFYEPFGGKSYYQGPGFEQVLDQGTYYVYFWDPYEMGGDYAAIFGDKELWGILDIIRALIETPKIRADEELHTECD